MAASLAQLKLLRHDLANENRVTELQIGRLARIKLERCEYDAELGTSLDTISKNLAKASLEAKTLLEIIEAQLEG